MKKHFLRLLFFCFLLWGPVSCKKFIEQQKLNAMEDIITKGTWRVSRYIDHQTDITESFSGYSFHFKTDGTVDGSFGGQTTAGTWVGDVNTRTIQSQFPPADDPLNKLNHTWKITDSYSDSVSANTLADTAFNYLELHKN